MQVKKQQLELDKEQQTGSKSGKEYFKAVYCHPAYFYAEYIMRNAEWDEAQAGIKIAGRNISKLYMQMTPPMAESKEELKSLLMKEKEESEKPGLKLNIQNTKIIQSHHSMANRWRNNRNHCLRKSPPKSLQDGDCSHEIKRCLLLGRKAMTNLDSILKNRDITLPTKVHLVKAMVFPVVMYDVRDGP